MLHVCICSCVREHKEEFLLACFAMQDAGCRSSGCCSALDVWLACRYRACRFSSLVTHLVLHSQVLELSAMHLNHTGLH